MGTLSENQMRRVDRSFCGMLEEHFGDHVPEITRNMIAKRFGWLGVPSLVTAARELMLRPTMPSASDCVRACQREADSAQKCNDAHTVQEMWKATSIPVVVKRSDPEWSYWHALCKVNGLRFVQHEMDTRDRWTMPCKHPRDFIRICAAEEIPIIDPFASAASSADMAETPGPEKQLASHG